MQNSYGYRNFGANHHLQSDFQIVQPTIFASVELNSKMSLQSTIQHTECVQQERSVQSYILP